MRRLVIVFSVVLATGVWSAPAAVIQAAPQAPTVAQGDFNGDLLVDLAVGVPGEDVGSVADAGAVNVLYGGLWSGSGSQLFTQSGAGGAAEPGDTFGDSVAVGNFNGDGFGDLAVGAPGENVGAAGDAGAVNVLYGSAAGLTSVGAQQFTQNSPGLPSSAESGDVFGDALAAGDFNGDGFADLAVGVPLEAGVVRAGAVTVLYGSAAGLSGAASQLLTQNSDGVRGSSEAGDRFGAAVAAGDFNDDGFAELAIGAPREDVYAVVDAGAVTVLFGSVGGLTGVGSQLFTQGSPGIGGSAERGDVFGFALAAGAIPEGTIADLAIGAPGEDVSTVANAGAATLLFGSAAWSSGVVSRTFTQNNVGPGNRAEAGDRFGYAVALGDFNGGREDVEPPEMDLAIGVPGEDVSSIVDAGLVNVVYNDWPNFFRNSRITQASPEQGDRYGFSLSSTNKSAFGLATVAVGVPGEDINTASGVVADVGAVSVLVGTQDDPDGANRGLVGDPRLIYQNSPGVPSSAEPGDSFGDALATNAR
jgi:hypothetical protein